MEPEEAAEARELLSCDEDTAGGLMKREYLAYSIASIVGYVIEDLRRNAEAYSDFDVQYVYVVDERKRLVGVLRLQFELPSQMETIPPRGVSRTCGVSRAW